MDQLELPNTQKERKMEQLALDTNQAVGNNNRTDGMRELMQAILRAKANFDEIKKNAINSYIGNRYATLNAVLESIEPSLAKENLLITHTLKRDGETLLLVTSVTHAVTMASISCEMELYFKRGDMQSLGSALTYARRYSLQLLLSLSAEDDDGVAAVGSTRQASSVFSAGNISSARQSQTQTQAQRPQSPLPRQTGPGGQSGRP